MKQTELKREIYNLNPDYNKFINVIADTQENLSLICFLGAGTSISQGYKNWNGYVQDLIQYWKAHLQDIINNDTLYQKVRAADLKSLDWLNEKSGFDNKRKVDLVHHLIKEYSKPKEENRNLWDTIYRKHVNDFEKSYFLEIDPINGTNNIIDQLLCLSALFITTNYDDQIEKSFRKFFHSEPNTLNDINELEKKKLTDKSIFHLHGTPKIQDVLLVSSSNSYNKLYSNNKYKKKIIEQIEKQKSTVLMFVGSSLQEEEILNLFNFKSPKLQKFALMQYRPDMGSDQAQLVHDYYKTERDIDIIWYGKQYNDLPIFLAILNQDVQEQLKARNAFVPAEAILNDIKSVNYSALDEHITRAIQNNEDFVDRCFENNLDEKAVEILISNESFVNKLLEGYRFTHFFEEANKLYVKLSNSTITKLIKVIEQMPGIQGEYSIVQILNKYSKVLNSKQKINYLLKNASKFLFRTYNPSRLSNTSERNLWLLCNLAEPNSFFSLLDILNDGDNKKIVFRMSSRELHKLLNMISKDKFIHHANFDEIINDERYHALFVLIKEERLLYYRNFPTYFYQNKLIQRLLINLKLRNELPASISVNKLIENIDYDDKLLGKETNQFVKRYANKYYKANFYIDGWGSVETEDVSSKPFFEVTPLKTEKSVNCLISNLTKIINNKPTIDGKSMEGQQNALINTLNNKKEWDNFAPNTILLLSKLINDTTLLKKYNFVINKMLLEGLKLGYIKNNLLNNYFKMIFNDPNFALGYPNREILDFIVTSRKVSQRELLYDYLFNQILPNKLNFHSDAIQGSDSRKWILLNSYINSEAYEYYSLIKTVIDKDNIIFSKKYKSKFIENINLLPKIEREYIKGRFCEYFENDPDLQSENAFIGFSHTHYVGHKNAEFFAPQVISLLNSDFNERVCMHNIIFVLAYIIGPDKAILHNPITETEYKTSIFIEMLNAYLSNKFDEKNWVIQWITWALKNLNNLSQLILNEVFRNIENYSKASQIFKLLVDHLNYTDGYSLSLPYVNFNKEKDYTKNSFVLIVKIINSLVEKNALKIGYSLTFSIEEILFQMHNRRYSDLISKLLSISKEILLPNDQKKLQKKFLN